MNMHTRCGAGNQRIELCTSGFGDQIGTQAIPYEMQEAPSDFSSGASTAVVTSVCGPTELGLVLSAQRKRPAAIDVGGVGLKRDVDAGARGHGLSVHSLSNQG